MSAPSSPIRLVVRPTGSFALEQSATFGFGPRSPGDFDGVMRLTFCLDRSWEPVGVEVRQPDPSTVEVRAWGSSDADAIERQVARTLSLDHDGTRYDQLGDVDPVIGRLQQQKPGLRPPLFCSPYEAASWAVLSARRSTQQVREVRRALAAEHGATFELAGQQEPTWPAPERLLDVVAWPGLTTQKIDRLHGVARAALDGRLDIDHLRALGPDGATGELLGLDGIGPFYASLVVIRACGWADVLPTAEPLLLKAVAARYGLDGAPDPATFERMAEPWRPFRTWASVLLRATSEDPRRQVSPKSQPLRREGGDGCLLNRSTADPRRRRR